MTYATVQAGALAVLRKLDEFDAENSTENDYRPLAVGKAIHAVFSRSTTSNSSMQEVPTGGSYDRRDDRRIKLELFVLHETDTLAARSLTDTITQTVLDHFDKWANLDQTANIVEIDADIVGAPEEWGTESFHYFRQVIYINVIELTRVTLA